ncbi:MAG: CPBP family intramembrane metalloprotease [Acidimicrobiia bacterium]|nr:CPBP family intramembrane metalloprotease [Acidimicrobiia bacterium]MBP8180950.1 CPBP family intramembrane metalloprotease [Acidimicrobiia bacterium]
MTSYGGESLSGLREVTPALGAQDPQTGRTVRWNVADFGLAWFAGLVGALIGSSIALSISGKDDISPALIFFVVFPFQNGATLASVWWSSTSRGLGSWARDFGVRFIQRDVIWALAGVVLQYAVGILTAIMTSVFDVSTDQAVAKELDDISGFAAVGAVLVVVFIAPFTEELLYRGVLLRSLIRKMSDTGAILVSGAVFAVVHLLGDFGTAPLLPGLFVLGCVLGYVTVQTGNLSRAFAIHMGFNAVTAIALLVN